MRSASGASKLAYSAARCAAQLGPFGQMRAASRAESRPESRPAGRCSPPCRGSTSWPGRDRAASGSCCARSRIVRGHRAAFAARAQVLAGIEAERRRRAHRAGLLPAVAPACEKYSAPCAWQASSITIRLYRSASSRIGVHVRHLPVEMHRNHRRHPPPGCAVDQLARLPIDVALRLQILSQLRRDPCCRCARRYPRNRGRAPACEIASVVAMNVFGTVTTMSPGPIPAAISAKRSASVPLPTPTQYFASQNAANSRSNSSTMRPADEAGSAPALAEIRGQLLLQLHMRRHQVKKRNASIRSSSSIPLRRRLQIVTHNSRAGFPATIALAGTSLVTTLPAPTIAFSPIITLDEIVPPDPIEAPLLTSVFSTFQSALGLQLAARGRGARINIVDERDAVADEHVVFDRHAFADEGVAGDLAVACPTVAFFWISTNAPILVSSPISQPYRLMNCDSFTFSPSLTSGAMQR